MKYFSSRYPIILLSFLLTLLTLSRLSNHNQIDTQKSFISPQIIQSPHLGSDRLGRSLAPRLLRATTTSLSLGLSSLIAATIIACLIAISAAHAPKPIAYLLLLLPKTLFILPSWLLVASLLQHKLPPYQALFMTLLIAPLFSLTQHIQLSLLSQQKQPYWLYAQSIGCQPPLLIVKHQLPYITYSITPFALSRLASLLILEGSLSYLGLGLQEPHLSLGLLLKQGQPYLLSHSYLFYIPAITLVTLLFGLQWLALHWQSAWQRL
jgi:peptide/nickel transport system permease protein